jgi:hypothetical protein
MRWRTLALVAGGVVAVAMAPGSSASEARAAAPTGFVRDVTNPWFPLRVGSRAVFAGAKDGQATREYVTVTSRRKTVAGVSCVVVADVLTAAGKPIERTHDWYVQDVAGNVWYFGEQTATFDAQGAIVSRDGSWKAGADGARAGIFMPARPTLGATHQQEYYRGHAEDHFTVAGLGTRVTVPYGTFRRALLTVEYTPLEPGAVDVKYYVRGIGVVREATALDAAETNELVSFTR